MVKLKDGFTGERALVLPRIIVDKMEEDPLTSMLHITDIGYYPKAKHHFRERKRAYQPVCIHLLHRRGRMVSHRQSGIYRIRQPVFYPPCGSSPCLCFRQIVSMDYLLYSRSLLRSRGKPPNGYPT